MLIVDDEDFDEVDVVVLKSGFEYGENLAAFNFSDITEDDSDEDNEGISAGLLKRFAYVDMNGLMGSCLCCATMASWAETSIGLNASDPKLPKILQLLFKG